MSQATPSRKPDTGPRTLLDVRCAIEHAPQLSTRQRADLISALNTFARLHLRPGENDAAILPSLARFPSSPLLLNSLLRRPTFARVGMKRSSWTNLRFRIKKCLRIAGVRVRGGYRVLSPDWRQLADERCRRAQGWIGLRGFLYWCSEEGIAPVQVDQTVFDRFYVHLRECDLRLHPRTTYLAACRAWNTRAGKHEWPPFRVAPILQRNWYALAWSDFGPGLVRDVERYLADATSPLRGKERMRPTTAKHQRAQIRRMASVLAAGGQRRPTSINSIADIATAEAAKSIVAFLLDRAAANGNKKLTATGDMFGCVALLHKLAKQWVGADIGEVEKLRSFGNQFKPEPGMSEKNRATLRCFKNQELVDRYLDLPETVFKRFRRKSKLTLFDAVKLQTATAIAMLSVAPIRPLNLSRLRFGENLYEGSAGDSRVFNIYFPGDDVKNRSEIHFEIGGVVFELVSRYIGDVRPLLADPNNDYLFVGRGTRHKHPAHLSTQIARMVEEEIGVRVTAHQFRCLAGFLYLVEHPGEYEVVRQFLGHKRLSTTMNFYAGMERSTAIKAFDGFVSRRRLELQQKKLLQCENRLKRDAVNSHEPAKG